MGYPTGTGPGGGGEICMKSEALGAYRPGKYNVASAKDVRGPLISNVPSVIDWFPEPLREAQAIVKPETQNLLGNLSHYVLMVYFADTLIVQCMIKIVCFFNF